MKTNLRLTKSLLCASLFLGLLSFSTTAMEMDDNREQELTALKSLVNEDYQAHYQDYHLRAITFIENDYYTADQKGALTILKKPVPQISEQGGFLKNVENSSSWPIAITNFKNPQVMNVYPIPSVDKWPVRGFVKKYNEELLRQVLKHIDQQKANLLKELSQ